MTPWASPLTNDVGRYRSASGAIYEARLGRVPGGHIGDAGVLHGGDSYF
jgi:hypothetical protein